LSEFDSYLTENERLLWAGEQTARRRSTDMALGVLISTVLMGPAAVFFLASNITILGTVLLFVPALVAYDGLRTLKKSAHQTLYGVSDRRVLLMKHGRPETLVSLRSIDVDQIKVSGVWADGSGNLMLKSFTKKERYSEEKRVEIWLLGIEDVGAVADLIRKTFATETR
jgi:hypothetical protein